ncbi:MAG: D-cysteine desulfhydrase family protein [Bacillota bacterium]
MRTLDDIERLHRMPRVPMAVLPTPLEEAPRMARAIAGDRAPRLYLKRDDLTGLATGGNKTRKLEFLVADAIRQGCDTLITTGAAQSNHARQTAAAGAKYGLKVILVLEGQDPGAPQGNHLLDVILGAEVRFAGVEDDEAVWEQIVALGAQLERQGHKAYLIPVGGSVPIGALGYVTAVLELAEQAVAAGIRKADVYIATGSAGTQGGVELGLRLARRLGFDGHCYGVSVSHRSREIAEEAARIANGTAELFGSDLRLSPDEIDVLDQYVGPGYAVATPDGVEAVELLARSEGVLLDPVYTGKAMAGLIDQVRKGRYGPGEPVIFWHTGGVPALFVYAEEFTRKK